MKYDTNNNEEEEGELFDFDSGDEVPEADRQAPSALRTSGADGQARSANGTSGTDGQARSGLSCAEARDAGETPCRLVTQPRCPGSCRRLSNLSVLQDSGSFLPCNKIPEV